jgi:Lipid desaturase domain
VSAGYGRGTRMVELASIAAFAALAVHGAWRLACAGGTQTMLYVLLALPAGWLASDFLSGLLHWACDSLGSASTPLVGRAFIRPFREHHADPEQMTRHDFVETHGASCFAALPFLAAACFASFDAIPIALQSVLYFTALGALFTNQCHKWAHMDEGATPRWVRWAQARGLVLPREHHRLHHRPPFDSHFCMSCGWMNPLLNAILRAWR